MRIAKPGFDAKAAELLAIEALKFLAEDAARLERFLALSGIGPADLRQAAREPGFLGAVLAHLADHEALLLEFAAQAGRNPAEVDTARRLLGRGDWERDTA